MPRGQPRLIAALLRHGDYHQRLDTPSAHQPFALTSEGQAQAHRASTELDAILTRELWRLHPVVDSSHMLRAWQTAEVMTGGLDDEDLEIECFDEMAERCVGAAANMSQAEIRDVISSDPRYPSLPDGWKADSHYRLPFQGAESLWQAGERLAGHLSKRMEELAEHARDDVVKLFVGHGAAFRHAACHLGLLNLDEVAALSMYHAEPVFIEFMGPGKWRHILGEWKQRNADSKLD
jgi:2,3-bisphosphoglycerate-dependent phosphoglycerate mutase